MKRACLVVVVSIVLVAAAGCGKSNRKTAYHPPTTQTSTQAATGNADQEDAVAKSNARNLVSGVEACFVDQQTYTSCKKPAGISVPLGSGPGQVEVVKADTATYTIVAHSKSGTNFKIEKGASGAATRSCGKPGTGGCPGSGTW